MKNKLNIVFYIVIGVLTLIAGLEGMYIFEHKDSKIETKEKIVYRGTKFLKENVKLDLPKEITIEASNFNYDNSLFLKLNSTKNISKADMTIEYYDADSNLIKTEKQTIGLISKNADYGIVLSYPNLKIGTYSGDIKISMTAEYDEDSAYLDQNLLKFTNTKSQNNENKETTVTIKSKNPYETFGLLVGYILLYKDGNLVDVSYATSTLEGENITLKAVFAPIAKDGQMDFVEYDDVKLVINSLY